MNGTAVAGSRAQVETSSRRMTHWRKGWRRQEPGGGGWRAGRQQQCDGAHVGEVQLANMVRK
eukprot:scaffold8023_cov103-Isochrysis_galbana.AAC.3